ncbi:Transposable element P transposase [Frankliniella fusca]|uniref:Transposable element P transposase n=1 Tax=Frankliniella fusca TaxID=407009 RepID=A0AAE1GWE7_9NEOP|nr:Transposable element P transposase [Frankliniella fusca]
MTDKVCSSHFMEKDIITHDKHVVNGKDVLIPRERALLNKGALPLQLQNYPPYYQPKINKRKGPPKRNCIDPKKKIKNVKGTEQSIPSNSTDGGSEVDQQEQVEISTEEISDQIPPVPEAPTQLVQECKEIIQKKILECRKKNEKVLAEAIQKLPPALQEAVKACFEASKKKSPCGRRYTLQWVYECMLIKIKSPSLYQHILDHNILPMPSITTIKAYLKKYRGAYGFQKSTFLLLEEKSEELPAIKRRGVLLLDEMKLPPGVYFEQSALKVEEFVNFGEGLAEFGQDLEDQYEEASQKLPCNPKQQQKDARKAKRNAKNEKKRDKNLGDHGLHGKSTWIQTLACFLSKGAADDEQLTKFVLEATILMENSNYFVDGVVTDGASWNRSMWDRFGEIFISYLYLLTPAGMIKLSHWNAVVEADSLREIGLRECPRLTKDHLSPNPWEKMRCGLAWQFWSHSAAAAMESFRFQGVEELEDCDASVQICKLVNNLADIMNSRLPVNALKANSPQVELLEYLKSEEIGYQFLMTSRLNQNALERFFGLMRQSCGPNSHPEPRVFVQLFKLLSVYSLVKPIKGSNITGGEMLHSLFSMEDFKSQTNIERRKELDNRLDDLVQAGANLDEIPNLVQIFEDHNYIEESMDDFALVYVAGYTARKAMKFSNKCSACEKSLIRPNPADATDEHLLIK